MTRRLLLCVVIGWCAAASCFAGDMMPVSPGRSEHIEGTPAVGRNGNGNAVGGQWEPGDYRIGPEDVLNIYVWNNTAISRTVPVRPDGRISLPLVNDVTVAGLTPTQVRSVLINKLADYVPSPEVSVIVEEVHSFKVSVVGEVKKTGRYELKDRATVLDILAMAEGFGDFASRRRIVILRREGKTMRQIPFNYNKALSRDGALENFLLRPGDIIVVP